METSEATPVALLRADVSARGIERLLWVTNPAKPAPCVASLDE